MNKQQRIFLRAIGFAIIILTFLLSYQYYGLTSEQKVSIKLINQACNFEYKDINFGEMGQALFDQYSTCEKVEKAIFILERGWIGYVIGIILMVAGIWHGLGAMKEK